MVMAACSSESSTTTTTTRAAVGAEATTTTQTATAATTTTAGAVATTEAQASTLTLSAGEVELVVVAGAVLESGVVRGGGFAVEGEDITSPGPTIRVRKGETVTITFENAHFRPGGRPFGEPHNFTVVADKDVRLDEMVPLWGAHVGGFDDPNLESGDSG